MIFKTNVGLGLYPYTSTLFIIKKYMTIALGFIGVVVSLIVQVIKVKYKLSKVQTLMVVAFVSFVTAILFKALAHYGLWEAFIAIVVSTGAIYTFILKHVFDAVDNIDKDADIE